ncbi:serine hydrolase [Bradyrhizobium sp.]|uniref:serine hydrolase n=1 Tax=Bradyrhizobium sp. TaxID=376 RepID=UPI003BAF3D93
MAITSMRCWWRTIFAAGLSLLACVLLGLPQIAMTDTDKDAKVRDIVEDNIAPVAIENDAGGLASAVYVAGHTWFFNYGLASRAEKRKITSDTLFNLASVRKVFDATLVALGTLRGEMRLDDPINKYVTELHGDYMRRVTLGQLSSHTSGVSLATDHPPWPSKSYAFDEFIDVLNSWTPHAGEEPGKQRIYSHAGYVLLQLALERRYGLPIGELIENRILKPLGMNSTLLPERGPDNNSILRPELMQRVVQGYLYNGMPIGAPGDQKSYFNFAGTEQMFSSARDLAIFLDACFGAGAADPQLLEALQMTQREMIRVSQELGQAMAWETVYVDGITIVDKPGGLNNASAYIGFVPARKVGVVLLANRSDFPYEIARDRLLSALSRLQ